MELLLIVLKTVFFYFFIVFVYRLMGKREIGQLGIIDLIVSILIAELVAISIENYNKTIVLTVIPILILVFLEMGFAFISMRSKFLRKVLDGKPSLIVVDGKINYKEMVKQRYSLEDLLLSLRLKEVKSLDMVEYAFLENNGRLSVFLFNDNKRSDYPMPIISDGKINIVTLKNIGKSKLWLNNEIKKSNIKLDNIFYAFLKDKKLYIIKRKDLIK